MCHYYLIPSVALGIKLLETIFECAEFGNTKLIFAQMVEKISTIYMTYPLYLG